MEIRVPCVWFADLDELIYVPAGDAALTRRARKYSVLSAVVLKFSKARGRYERQGVLVEENALAQAEAECLADGEARERRARRQRERSTELDRAYVQEFARRIRDLFPHCPEGREVEIAEHACRKYSGRVGDRRRLRVLTNALYCWQWLPMCAIVKQITITFWQSKQDALLQELE
jgi:hypothetical protein